MTQMIPEDSMLRRHYLSGLHWQVRAELGARPSDSVLARHYDQQADAEAGRRAGSGGTAPAGPSRPAPAASAPPGPSPSAPAASAPPAPQAQAPAESSGGFFGWLKRLFGG